MTRIILPWFAALLGLGGLLSLAVEAQSHPLRQLVVVGTVAGDGALHGVLTITGLALNETGQLVATGTLAGTAGTQVIQETWTALAAQFRQGEGSGVCTQLLLDLAPAHLDGVGLTVEVARNLSIRHHVAAVGRWVATLCKGEDGLRHQLALYHGYYNFCLPHSSLRRPLLQPESTIGTGSAKQWQPCTPAMAAGLADRVWTLREVLLFRVPPWPQPVGL